MSEGNAVRRIRAILASPRVRLAARLIAGVGVLVAVVAQVGAGPFLLGLRSIDLPTVGAALLLAAVATGAAAWRWRVVATRLGAGLSWPAAVAMYYRSQFLNTVLPGGVLGDVQRAVAQGRMAGSLPQGARAVVIERTMGQLVQIGLAVVVLACFAPELEGALLVAVGIVLASLLVIALVVAVASARTRRAVRRELAELSAGVGSPGALAQVVVASLVVVACHVTTFGLAAAAVGAAVPPPRLAAIALLVLLAASIPLNVGGWGPREGVAGWAFGIAGLGVAAGVAASTLFGVLTVVSVAPGLVLVAATAIRSGLRAARSAHSDDVPDLGAPDPARSPTRPGRVAAPRAFTLAGTQRKAGS